MRLIDALKRRTQKCGVKMDDEEKMINYERKHKLNQRQKYFLMAIGKGWLARSESRDWLWVCIEKPTETRETYFEYGGYVLSQMIAPEFPFIQNGDEPYSIEEMLNWETDGEQGMNYTETYKITTDIKIDSFIKNTENTGISFGFSFYYASKPANIEKIVEDAANKYKEVFTKALQNAIGD